ncbi:MAG: thiolase family protein [Elusimicrobia bacterium]|nr:thiolase family protein [Elusimicrobiota bacterium]
MADKPAIIGVGQTEFGAPKTDQTFADLTYEAVNAALVDAELDIKDIDNIITVSNDFWDGRTISSMAVGDAVGAAFGQGKNISTVEGDGAFGAFYGLARILSGSYQNTLVVAHSKGSEGDNRLITNAFFDPIFERSLGMDSVTAAALQAKSYMEKYKISPRQTAMVSVKNRANALKNPKAHLREELDIEDILRSPQIAPPIRRHDACPVSDGAAALILANEDFAKKRSGKPVWVEGVAFCADAYRLGERALWESRALREAAKKAYAMAGIADPRKEIGVAEIYEAFSYQELLWSEELGFASPGGGGALLESRVTQTHGELPVNPSGGCLSAHAVCAAGLVRMIEAALQIRGDAANPVRKPKKALAHGQNGLCGQSHCVWILGAN